jgi:hypothetical protein
LLGYFVSVFRILCQFGVTIRDRGFGMSKPESDEVFWRPLFSQPRRPESPHGVESRLLQAEFMQDRME